MVHDKPLAGVSTLPAPVGKVTWTHGLTHARRKRLTVGVTQAVLTALIAALSFEIAYLMLNSWPASLGQVRESPYSFLPILTGLVRLISAPEFAPYLPLFFAAPPVLLAVFRWLDLFGLRSGAIVPFGQSVAILRGTFASVAMLLLLGLSYTSALTGKPVTYMLMYFAFAGAVMYFGLLLAFSAVSIVLLMLRSMGLGLTRLLLIGDDEETENLSALFTGPNSDYALVGRATSKDDAQAGKPDCPALGSWKNLADIINSNGVDEVILAVDPGALDAEQRLDIALTCWRLGAELKMITPFYPYFHTKGQPEIIGDTPLLTIERVGLYVGRAQFLKRACDILVSILVLVVLFPLLLTVAILIRLDSPGPILFTQERPGLHGRVFRIFKFRSMRTDADSALHREAQRQLIKQGTAAEVDEQGNPIYGKVKADPRVTRIGRFIRKTSIDEFPQLINVLRGEMSLVGPRPSVLYELENYSEHHLRRLNIRPGMTGLWQVSGRSRLSFEQMVELDIKYIEEWSLWLDFKILLRTIPVVLRLDQAY